MQQMLDRIQHCFKDHRASSSEYSNGHKTITVIDWRKPGTSIEAMRFVFIDNCLTVYGDLYEAVYLWSQPIKPEFVAGCNIDYMMEKCMASPYGAHFRSWKGDTVREAVAEEIENWEGDPAQIEKINSSGWQNHLNNQDCWNHFLMGNGEALFGANCYEDFRLVGLDYDICAYYHWMGIKLAVAQLRK